MRAEDKPLQAPSLLELSANVVARDDACLLYEKCSRDPSSSSPAANFVVALPMAVAEIVVKHVCRNMRNESASADSAAKNLRPFLDGALQPLGRLDLSGLNISHRTLALLLAAQQSTLTSLDLSNICLTPLDISSGEVCDILTDLKVKPLKLSSLKVTSCDLLRLPRFRVRKIRKSSSLPAFGQGDSDLVNDRDQGIATADELSYDAQKLNSAQETNIESIKPLRHFVDFCPNIQHLYLQQGLLNDIKNETADEFLLRIFNALKGLRTLDLSEWDFPNHLLILEKVPNLTTLILYDVQNLESCIPMISGLKNLKCLDLSQSDHETGHYIKPVTCLHTLVTELTNLECLDISGTNLTSEIDDDDEDRPDTGVDFASSYIAGLSFLNRPLKYLGIFDCVIASHVDNGFRFENIPAEKICCDHDEDQLILAMETYMSRPYMLEAALDDCYHIYHEETCLKRHVDVLHLLLQVFSSHRTNSSLQVDGHIAMFYILPKVEMNRDTKHAVLCELLNAMENYIDKQEMLINCCRSISLFEIPQDFLLNYIRIAKQLVRVLVANRSNLNIQRFVLELLNSMALNLDQSQKIYLGSIGIIEISLDIIRRNIAEGTCEIAMQLCWAILCSITDETPSNCERFLKAGGMKLFSQCISQFPNALVVNMVVLVRNVAEVKCLRSQLMDNDYVNKFWNLLHTYANSTNGFEISYSSAYILAHLFGEGEAAWQSVRICRRGVMKKMVEVIGTWNLSTKLLFQYRSLKPILQLLTMFHSPASVHLAVWALANLTSTDPEKYCRYVDEEGGEKLVRKLVYDTTISSRTSILARVVLANMDNWRKPGAITASANSDEAIVPARQNSNPYLKKVSRIMMRFLPIWLPVSTLVIASMYVGSYEQFICLASYERDIDYRNVYFRNRWYSSLSFYSVISFNSSCSRAIRLVP